MLLKNFIVFEGIDGSGTSTQMSLLRKKTEISQELNDKFLFTAEPTPCATGKFLRQVLKGDFKVSEQTTALLFAADRSEHLYGITETEERTLYRGIVNCCNEGKIVVSDRYFFSSMAYQRNEESVKANENFPLPQLLFYFDITAKESLARIQNRDVTEIYEKESYLNETTAEYKKIIQKYSDNQEGMKIVIIDATKPVAEVEKQIWQEIENLIR